MAFGLSITGGDFLPSIRINGKDGTVHRSTWDGTNRGMEEVEQLVCLMDFNTTQVGWIKFDDKGPDKRLVAIGDPLPDRPSEDHKQGIQIIVYLPGGLGCHEICVTAIGILGALESIHDTVLASPEHANGMVPVVQLKEFKKEKTKHGTRAVPIFEILQWKPRPDELIEHAAKPKPRAALPSQNAGRPALTGSTPMTPPAQKQAVPDFG